MSSQINKPAEPTFFQQLDYAVDAVKSSGALAFTFGLSLVALVEKLFKAREWLAKIGIDPEKATVGFMVLWIVSGVLAVRTVFRIAAHAGFVVKNAEVYRNQADAKAADAERRIDDHLEAFGCLHAVIHRTRDSLLSGQALHRMVAMSAKEVQTQLYQIIESQLGMMEKAFRTLTEADCCVVLKLIDRAACHGHGGFVSACYSPSTPIARRNAGTPLPLNQGIAQEAVITKQICYTNDVTQDVRFWPQDGKDRLGNDRYKTVVACPVITNGEVLGVLCFDWRQPGMYSKRYNDIFACFTDVVSAAFYICYEARSMQTSTKEARPKETGINA